MGTHGALAPHRRRLSPHGGPSSLLVHAPGTAIHHVVAAPSQVGHGRHGRHSSAVGRKVPAQRPLDVVVLPAVVVVLGLCVEEPRLRLALPVLQLPQLLVQRGHVPLRLGHQSPVLGHLRVQRLQHARRDARRREPLDVGRGGEQRGLWADGPAADHAANTTRGRCPVAAVRGRSPVLARWLLGPALLGLPVAGGVDVDLVQWGVVGRAGPVLRAAVAGRSGPARRAAVVTCGLGDLLGGDGPVSAAAVPRVVDQPALSLLLLDGHLHRHVGHIFAALRGVMSVLLARAVGGDGELRFGVGVVVVVWVGDGAPLAVWRAGCAARGDGAGLVQDVGGADWWHQIAGGGVDAEVDLGRG